MCNGSMGLSAVLTGVLALGAASAGAGPDATLESLAVSAGPFAPPFSPGSRLHVLPVGNSVAAVTVMVKPKDPAATVTLNGKPLAAEKASEPVALNLGRNVLTLEVTAADGTTKNAYTVKVFRAHPTPDWTRVVEQCPWKPRDSAGEVAFNGRLWLLGGYVPEVIAVVWSSADGKEWTQAGTIDSPMGVNIPVNYVYNNRMWVTINDGRLYNSADGAAWTLVTDKGPWAGRYAPGGTVFNGRMWILGGLERGKAIENDVWSSTDGVSWTLEVAEAPWSKRQLFSMVQAFDDKLWVIGGGITMYHPFKAYTDVWNSPDGKTRTRVDLRHNLYLSRQQALHLELAWRDQQAQDVVAIGLRYQHYY